MKFDFSQRSNTVFVAVLVVAVVADIVSLVVAVVVLDIELVIVGTWSLSDSLKKFLVVSASVKNGSYLPGEYVGFQKSLIDKFPNDHQSS